MDEALQCLRRKDVTISDGKPDSFRSRHRSKPKAFSLGSWLARISANYSNVLWLVDKLHVPWQTVPHVSVRAMGEAFESPSALLDGEVADQPADK